MQSVFNQKTQFHKTHNFKDKLINYKTMQLEGYQLPNLEINILMIKIINKIKY